MKERQDLIKICGPSVVQTLYEISPFFAIKLYTVKNQFKKERQA